MELWVATTNTGKLNEFRNLLSEKGVTIRSNADLKSYTSPPETGKTFLENARIKAKSLAAVKRGVWVAGEDSGLEVEGLGNNPGIFSARYAGDKASDAENNAKVLKMLKIRSPLMRKARFRCALVAFSPEGKEYAFEGVVEGQIADKIRGTEGFGYDVIFIPEGESKTFAELGLAFKNRVSHRGQAIKKFAEVLFS
jgi:XTP/dITP diphosphohydrolase